MRHLWRDAGERPIPHQLRRWRPILILVLLGIATPAPGSRQTNPLDRMKPVLDRSPLFRSRLDTALVDLDRADQNQRRFFFRGLVGADPHVEIARVETPLSLGLSACVLSACLASFCTQSGCLGSYCQASGCLGSYCILSGCTSSFCGGSFCVDSACLASACINSSCVNGCEENRPELKGEE